MSSPVEGILANTTTLAVDGGVFLIATTTVSGMTDLPDIDYPPQE